ncbi:hypothetical protein AHAS_Ahas15G0341400 [Arachis hypogaea]
MISTLPVRVQVWGLPEQFKTLEVGCKLGSKLGLITDIDFFKVKGKESRIIKAKVELEDDKKLRDSMKLMGPNQQPLEVGLRYERIGVFCTYCASHGHETRNCQLFLEDSSKSQIKQESIGDWVKADQVGRRVERQKYDDSRTSRADGHSPAQPRKKPALMWLLESFSSLSMEDKKQQPTPKKLMANSSNVQEDKDAKMKTANTNSGAYSLNILRNLSIRMNTEEYVATSENRIECKNKKVKLKQLARIRDNIMKTYVGNKRSNSGKENEGS